MDTASLTDGAFCFLGGVLDIAVAARFAPASMRGTVTGGVLSFGQFGGLVLPLLYSQLLCLTGSYQLGFWLARCQL